MASKLRYCNVFIVSLAWHDFVDDRVNAEKAWLGSVNGAATNNKSSYSETNIVIFLYGGWSLRQFA